MIVLLNESYLPMDQARISPDDRGFLFGDGVYEVWMLQDGQRVEDPAHWARLNRSLAALKITLPEHVNLAQKLDHLVVENGLGKGLATLYLQVTRGVAARKHAFPHAISPTIYAFCKPFRRNELALREGASAITVEDTRWSRCDIKSIALLPNVLANQMAQEAGAAEALFVREGRVLEGSHSNLFVVRGNEIWTAPDGPYILAGVTRNRVLALIQENRLTVKLDTLTVEQLKGADEAFLTGTTTEITPLVHVDGLSLGLGQPGPITRRLQRCFFAQSELSPPGFRDW
ncbi:MAG: aminotransferase class IV [Acidobacteria bacterium]|nr:aminotransferase class IV [Acidobacteriota bacterium]